VAKDYDAGFGFIGINKCHQESTYSHMPVAKNCEYEVREHVDNIH